MPAQSEVTEEQMERARGDGKVSLQIRASEEFLQWINVQSAKRGMSNRDFTIKALLSIAEDAF